MKSPSLLKFLGLSVSAIVLASCQQTATNQANAAMPVKQFVSSKKAKNVILFIGDGMGVSTITAARIFDGQSKGMSGEDNQLSFETFPNVSLVKTYNLDSQVADSAGTASAMNTGFKTQIGKINVQPDALFAKCSDEAAAPPVLFADLAETAGMSTGIISTARITHATPAAVYGHAMSRGWESDRDMSEIGNERGCTDLATQMIEYGGTNGLEVALGGGRRNFIPKELEGGRRDDGKNLTTVWTGKSDNHIYASNVSELRAISAKDKQSVLGLFDASHMNYEADRSDDDQPSLTEMTSFAIENLAARDTGYYLMVEAGRIDHAHHGTNAYRALKDTQELSEAVAKAVEMTNPEDTLILVTADHSHVLSIAGYPGIGNPILGVVKPIDRETGKLSDEPLLASDGKPYTTLGYHNGPNTRTDDDDLSDNAVQGINFQQQTAIPMGSETHAGEDVPLYAYGPGAQKARGVIDQAEIFDIMVDAVGFEK
ncbi:MAG: alkaline phosphatase [Hyphomonadaceae bacterium]|nr:alkaline phosphatase [Hyphomonadaceae bacterium]